MRIYQIKTFSDLTGLSIRSLQYYDSVGILRPSHKNSYGHRLYSERDFLRLQQVSSLKMLGWSLKDIQEYLSQTKMDVTTTLGLQQTVLQMKLNRLQRAQKLTQFARNRLAEEGELDTARLAEIIQLINDEEPLKKEEVTRLAEQAI